ncbi:hypothetical protein Tco_0728428 [Tanacetum coccineum]|uniref:Uncharacterized protein n=1 Tax=Tanacetum coccineum TaxID=301880 RepID=A0ABQ4YNR3_9ASTR
MWSFYHQARELDMLVSCYGSKEIRFLPVLTRITLADLMAHIVKLRDILEGVLVRSGLSRVWHNPMCDPVLRRSDNTVMSIHDFLCMPSLEKATVQEEPHQLGTSILGRVADRTTPPALAGTAIPRASLEEIVVTRPDRNVVTKADHAAKQKTSTGPEISTNTTKRTKLSQKVSGAGSRGLAAKDGVEQIDDGTLDDDGQRDGSEFAMEDIGNLNDVGQGEHINRKEELTRARSHCVSCVSEDASSSAQEAVAAPDTQPLGTDAGTDEIASDGNVDPYFDARVSNTARDVLEMDLLPFFPGPYYIPYPFDEGSKELYKDPKVCRTALDRFPTPVETHRLRELSSVELSDRMINCGATKHKLSSWDKKHRKYRNERDTLAKEKTKIKEELVGTKSQLEHRERQAEEIHGSIASFFYSEKVVGFILDAKEKFDRVIAAFPDTTFPFLDKPSSTTASLRTNTHVRHSTSSPETFGHTSTPEHLKKKKKYVGGGGPSAA